MQGSQDMGVIGVEVVARQNAGHLWFQQKKWEKLWLINQPPPPNVAPFHPEL